MIEDLREEFHPAHHDRFGHSLKDNPIELVSARLEARGTNRPPAERATSVAESEADPVPVGSRPAWFGDGFLETQVYRAAHLAPGAAVAGPAMIELSTSTIVVPPTWELAVHASGAFLIHSSSTALETVIDRLDAGGVSA
jgi:N-methylhydantoinase A/oxoprolinase/acetone carboxylase beta subunit